MPTGFEKFSKKALQEQPITIRKVDQPAAEEKTVEEQQVAKLTTAVRQTAPVQAAPAAEEKPRRGRKPIVREDDEEMFTMTIKIKMSTKLKLDELKFTERKTLQDLTAEAFEDLYAKYRDK